jgi:hypothetical protein
MFIVNSCNFHVLYKMIFSYSGNKSYLILILLNFPLEYCPWSDLPRIMPLPPVVPIKMNPEGHKRSWADPLQLFEVKLITLFVI